MGKTQKPIVQEQYRESNDDGSLDLYLKEIGQVRLLTPQEEISTARRARLGDLKARERLTKANLRFVVSVAKQYRGQGLPLSDLISEGNHGLMKAVERFDETKGFKFISFAVWWIRQSILQAIIKQSRIVRLPMNQNIRLYRVQKNILRLQQALGREPYPEELANVLDLKTSAVQETLRIPSSYLSFDAPFSPSDGNTLYDALQDENALPPDEILIRRELQELIEQILYTLKPREAEVICLCFGLRGEKPLTLEEIGTRYNLTRERVRQIKEKAILRLRHASRSKLLKDYLNSTFQ
jgi:RNA polymerase primary sigma factor